MRLRRALLFVFLFTASPAWATIHVVTTIYPFTEIVRQIGGTLVEATTLLPSGANPHTFEPTPRQVRDIAATDLIIEVGAGLDTWVRKLLDSRRTGSVLLTMTDGIELLEAHEEHAAHGEHAEGAHQGDPHVWLDPILMRDVFAPRITSELVRLLPQQREILEQRSKDLRRRLTQLDEDVRRMLLPFRGRSYIAFHSAWRYFSRRYELKEAAVAEPFPGKELSAREMIAVVESARRSGARILLVEPQFSTHVAEQLANEFGGRVVAMDPFGGPDISGRESYEGLLRYNAKVLSEALQ